MSKSGALFAVTFVAGQLASLASALFLQACAVWLQVTLVGIHHIPQLSLDALAPGMVIGGLWGLGYFFTIGAPRQRNQWIRKALWFSLLPSLFALFYLYPYLYNRGLAALDFGAFAPAVIVLANLVWGFFTGFFTRLFWGR